MAGSAVSFSHTPLKYPDHQFRIVKIRPRSVDDIIDCELCTVNLQDKQNVYLALSYLWGPPTPVYSIQLNGKEFFVRENLWHFLQLGQTRFAAQPIFIDAICIDQVNVHERNKQVQLMGDIYLHCSQVVSWLGQGDTNLDAALPFVESVAKTSSEDPGLTYHEDDDDKRARQQVWLGVYLLCRLRYWTRVWIVQELIKPKEVSLLYGTHCLPWKTLQTFLRIVRQTDPCPAPLPAELFSSEMAQFVDARQRSVGGFMRCTMRDVLLMYGSSACSETRDCVFALLSLPLYPQNRKLTVDYAMPLSELFMRVIKIWGSEGGENVLFLAKHMASNLVSLPDTVKGKDMEPKDFSLKLVRVKRLEEHVVCSDSVKCCVPEIWIQLPVVQMIQNGSPITEDEAREADLERQSPANTLNLGQIKHSQLQCDDMIFQLDDTALYVIGRVVKATIRIVALLSVEADELNRRSQIVARWLPWSRPSDEEYSLKPRGTRRYELQLNTLMLRSLLSFVDYHRERIEIIEPSGIHRWVTVQSLSWQGTDCVSFDLSAVGRIQALYKEISLRDQQEGTAAKSISNSGELTLSQAHQALKSSRLDMTNGQPGEFVPTPSWRELLGRR